jgi:large subunit ribosomal protein L25
MKSITIKGSERESVGKVATKPTCAGLVPLRIIRRKSGSSFLSRSYGFQKTWFTLKRSQLRSILEKENHLTLFYKTFKFTQSDKILHIDFFQIFDDKEITMEVPVKIIGNSKELWQVEIYV